MPDSITVTSGLKIQDKGVFSLEELCKNIKAWFEFYGFGDEEKTFREESYVERIKGDSKQIEFSWKAEKFINEYISYVITMTFNITGLAEIEIEQNGRKIKTNKGSVTIKIGSKLLLDRQDKWKGNIFKKIYEAFIIKERIKDHLEELYNKTYTIHDEIKAFFDMNR